MKNRYLKKTARATVLLLAVAVMFSLMAVAGTEPIEPVEAAEPRGPALMAIPEIPGTYETPPYENHIQLLHLDCDIQAASNSGDSRDPWATRPTFSEITVTKELDRTSPLLNLRCARGDILSRVEIKITGGEMMPVEHYYTTTLEDAVITRVRSRVVFKEEDSGFAHLEEVSFKFKRITWKDEITGVEGRWDVEHNESL